MLDLEREDESLRQAVGADSRAILQAASPAWADRFFLARERLVELAAERNASADEVLERDRLASFFGCAYGRQGLLARAGALLTLRDRLFRLALLSPRLSEDATAMARVRREAIILRSFAREHLARAWRREGAPVAEAVAATARVCIAHADFVTAACAIDRDRGGYRISQVLWAAADLSHLVAAGTPQRPLMSLAGFALARLADYMGDGGTNSAYDALTEAHLSSLRQELWDANEALFTGTGDPAPLAAIEEADRDLERVFLHILQPELRSGTRARIVGELYGLVSAVRAAKAGHAAAAALDGTLLLLAEGLAAESRRRP